MKPHAEWLGRFYRNRRFTNHNLIQNPYLFPFEASQGRAGNFTPRQELLPCRMAAFPPGARASLIRIKLFITSGRMDSFVRQLSSYHPVLKGCANRVAWILVGKAKSLEL